MDLDAASLIDEKSWITTPRIRDDKSQNAHLTQCVSKKVSNSSSTPFNNVFSGFSVGGGKCMSHSGSFKSMFWKQIHISEVDFWIYPGKSRIYPGKFENVPISYFSRYKSAYLTQCVSK